MASHFDLDVLLYVGILSERNGVAMVFTEMLQDALKRHRARKAEEERRQKEVAQLKQQLGQKSENENRLMKRIRELENERNGGPPTTGFPPTRE